MGTSRYLAAMWVNTILEDSKGNIWIGTRGNAGIYDGNTFTKLNNEEGKSFFNVW